MPVFFSERYFFKNFMAMLSKAILILNAFVFHECCKQCNIN